MQDLIQILSVSWTYFVNGLKDEGSSFNPFDLILKLPICIW
jgi:hypothetical protein